jgi:hypothetical protein
MAYNLVTNGLVQSAGITYSATTIDSTDWASVPNDTRFYDFDTKIVYYKDVSGNIISVFSTSGGTVTSVGLTMPSAFGVANSPVTSSGSLDVTALGSASQYIRGDGVLATLPTSSGGGSSVSYYLNGSINQGTFSGDTYYQLSKTAIIGGGTNFNIATNGIIARFITDANDPDQLSIPNGAWNLRFYFSADSSGGTPEFYINLYKYDGATFTLISSGSTNPEVITGGTIIDQYFTSIAVPTTALAVTDRLAVEVYVINDTKTITLHTENSNLCQIVTTFATGLTALNGLTDSVQYFAVGTSGTDFGISSVGDTHTFNLPVADATNTGKLSSTDWSTFNNKLDTNIYNGDGTLTSNRTISATDKTFTLSGNNASTIFTFSIDDGTDVSSVVQENDTITNVVRDAGSTLVSQTFMNNTSWSIDITDPTNQGTIDVSTTAIQLRVTQGLAIKKLIVGTSGIQINSAYYLPNADGTAGQVVITDGAGNLSFATSTSTNIYNTNGTLTADRTLNGDTKTLDFDNVSLFTTSVVPLSGQSQGYVINVNSSGILNTSGTRIFKISDSNGNFERFGITKSGNVKINNAFSFPLVDGTANQVLQTDGSGVVSWGTVTSTNIYNSNGSLTGNRTVTMSANNLLFLGAGGSSQTYFERSNNAGIISTIKQLSQLIDLTLVSGSDGVLVRLANNSILTQIVDGATGFESNFNQLYDSFGLYLFDAGGTTINAIEVLSTGVQFNNEYTFPLLDGTANQVLQTNGSGVLSFVTPTSGTVTSVGLTTGTTGVDINVSNSPITSSGNITLNIPTASATNRGALSSTDWSTFNGKQNAITLTTTGTSGASTLIGSTLNIPIYGFNVTTQSGASYSASTSDYVLINASTFILTLPSASANAQVGVKMINATVTSIQVKTASAGVTIDGIDRSSTGLGLYNQYDAYVFISDGTNWFIVS